MSMRMSLRSAPVRVGALVGAFAALGPSIVLGQRGVSTCDGLPTVFAPTGSVQQLVVPPGMNTLTVDAAGAQGGATQGVQQIPGNPGGNGARLIASFPVTPGEVLRVVVGETGGTSFFVAGGGGGSFVYRTPDLAGLLIAAAGGGGGSGGTAGLPGSASSTASNGESNGGGTGGAAGTGGNGGGAGFSPAGCAGAGGGGLLTDGGDDSSAPACTGTGGASVANGSAGGSMGSADGGFGGGGSATIIDFGGGSGGGGGFNGGGGGGSGAFQFGANSGGGGGSFSATPPTFSATGTQSGDGAVSFCFGVDLPNVPTLGERGLAMLCAALAALGAWTLRRRLRQREVAA